MSTVVWRGGRDPASGDPHRWTGLGRLDHVTSCDPGGWPQMTRENRAHFYGLLPHTLQLIASPTHLGRVHSPAPPTWEEYTAQPHPPGKHTQPSPTHLGRVHSPAPPTWEEYIAQPHPPGKSTQPSPTHLGRVHSPAPPTWEEYTAQPHPPGKSSRIQ